MRTSAASRELHRDRGERLITPGYLLVARKRWADDFRVNVLPAGIYVWYKAQDALGWLRKISAHDDDSSRCVVRFLDDAKYNVAQNVEFILW